jgi:hypothetical protein
MQSRLHLHHEKLEELLRSIEPKPNTVKLMKEILKRQSIKDLGSINGDISELRGKLDEIATIRTKTFKKFISGQLSEEDKQSVIDDLDAEKLNISSQLSELEQQQTVSESQIEYALNFMMNVAKQWADAELSVKQHIQNLIFPDGFVLDIKNDSFIESKISPLYRLIKPEMETDSGVDFSLVIPRGIEPLLPG